METNPSNEATLGAPTGSSHGNRKAVENLVAATFLAPPTEAEIAESAGKKTMAESLVPSNQEEADKIAQVKEDAKALAKTTPEPKDDDKLPEGEKETEAPKDEKTTPVSAKEPISPDGEKTEKTETEPTDEELDKEASGKIRNVKDARRLYKEHKKLEKTAKEKEAQLAEAQKKQVELEAKIKAVEDSPRPDAEKLRQLEAQLAEYQGKEEYVNKELARIEEIQAANDVQNSNPYVEQVSKPLAALSEQLLELSAVVSEDKDEQIEFAQRFNSVLQIGDSIQRRRALEAVLAPLTDYQRSEAIQIANEYKKAIGVHTTLMSRAKEAQKILQAKAEIQQREQMKGITKQFVESTQNVRQDLAKAIPFLANPPTPEWKGHIEAARKAADGVDFSKITPNQFAALNESAHTLPVVLEAAKVQMAAYEKQIQEAKTQLTERDAKIKELEAKVGEREKEKAKSDSTRPRATDGTFTNATPDKKVTAESWAKDMLAMP